jgi:hypothetical protein
VITALIATPGQIVLHGRYAEARLLVDGRFADGGVRDVSGKVTLSVADPKVATVSEGGMVQARGDGRTTLIARFPVSQGAGSPPTLRVPIRVQGVAKAEPPRYVTDVLPVLTRAGCNQGACHGAQQGKGGFRLSLLGYDPDFDHEQIVRASGGRRLSRVQPDGSLLLRKPLAEVAHKGGRRFAAGSLEHRILRDWIVGGAKPPAGDEARVVRLEPIPAVRTLAQGQTQRFVVRAHYSDGTQRDATGQTLFTASDETVTAVDPTGEAKVVGPGEGAVVIRYQGLVATAQVVSPFGPVAAADGTQSRFAATPASQKKALRASATQDTVASEAHSHSSRASEASSRPTGSPIDRLVFAKLAALGLTPSGPCSDADFLRRAYLDVIGLLPTPEEARAFLGDRDPEKREKLIDALLARPEYVDFWAMKWGDVLRNSRRQLTDKGMFAFNRWIRDSVLQNKAWDQMARELLLARGSGFDEGPANYFRLSGRPEELAETTVQVFLGVRMQCARCHNHPYERWTQNQYYEMASFFARVKNKNGEQEGERITYLLATGEVKHPRTGKEMVPTALDAAPMPKSYRGDRRVALVDWITSPKNPYFAHILVNRVWRHFMGRGLVEPVDDLRATNPPTNAALFDYLAQEFVAGGYDVKHLMRTIMRSRTYQLSSQPTAGNERDTKYYSHYPFKRLGAEQLLDAVASATGVPEKFDGFPMGTRATQLPDSAVPSYFLDLFGRPARQITCECERTDMPSVAQVLHLMNSAGINNRLASKEGRVVPLVEAKKLPHEIVDELYLAALSRYPTAAERRAAAPALALAKDRSIAAQDLMWALLNSKEFVFNH